MSMINRKAKTLISAALMLAASSAYSAVSCQTVAEFSAVTSVKDKKASSGEVMGPGVLAHLQRECEFGRNVYRTGLRGADYGEVTFDHGTSSYPGMTVGHMHAMTTMLVLVYAMSEEGDK